MYHVCKRPDTCTNIPQHVWMPCHWIHEEGWWPIMKKRHQSNMSKGCISGMQTIYLVYLLLHASRCHAQTFRLHSFPKNIFIWPVFVTISPRLLFKTTTYMYMYLGLKQMQNSILTCDSSFWYTIKTLRHTWWPWPDDPKVADLTFNILLCDWLLAWQVHIYMQKMAWTEPITVAMVISSSATLSELLDALGPLQVCGLLDLGLQAWTCRLNI